MFGTMIMLNLFIGVILNSMDEAQRERELEHIAQQRASGEESTMDEDIAAMQHQLDELKKSLEHLSLRLK